MVLRRAPLAALLIAIGCASTPPPPAKPVEDRTAQREKMLARLRESKDTSALFAIAELESRLGRPNAALDALERLEASGWDVPLDDDLFPTLRELPRYRAVAAKIGARAAHVSASTPGFTIAERGLIPEGIAFDPRDGTFFVSSIARRKVVAVNASGEARDLVHSRKGGLMETLGMKVDPKRNVLWVASSDEDAGDAGVFAFDLPSGELARKATLKGGHLLNDVAFDERGSLFVTDSTGGGVFLLVPAADKLLPYIEPGTFTYPNGIALSDEKAKIFVAHTLGIAVIDRNTKSIRELLHDAKSPTAGVDGLALSGRSLYAVQNGIGKPRIVRFELDETMEKVERLTVLENESPAFQIPTTGVVASGSFWFIANSQLDVASGPPEKWREAIVLKVPL